MTTQTLLIGDIGGTNARFAIVNAGSHELSQVRTLQCADFETAESAINHYLKGLGAVQPDAICLAVAGPVVEQEVRFTNNPWVVRSQDLKQSFKVDNAQLLNDFEAIAYAVPSLTPHDVVAIGRPHPEPLARDYYTVGVIGPGTGLGVVGLKKFREYLIPIVGEASHGGFSPESDIQIEILRVLRERFERVSSERLVSGAGIENIFWALCQVRKQKRPPKTAAQIFAARNEDELAAESVSLFFEILGQVCGDIALAFGAADGMYIAGGIAKRYATLLATSKFRTAFESKGRHRAMLEKISTQLIMHPEPGLMGATSFAQQMIR